MKRHNEEILAKQLGALAHPARLAAIRQLTAAGPVGLSAGKLGERVGMAPSALTFHLPAPELQPMLFWRLTTVMAAPGSLY